ncbi:class I SAM-dependent methyltransferase [Alienimonas sp. DA493]|uniref:class I SAM-dependent methyltransferase n=1 Tax=Alienimonas sp. DA493 TaxID=3373605 RepID=UPI003754E441
MPADPAPEDVTDADDVLVPIPPDHGEAEPAPEEVRANLYDFPKYYDLVFGSDWKAEYDFLRECFDKYRPGEVKTTFEPACGTGRLMVKLGKAGYEVAGNDLNEKAVAFCNARLKRHGLPETAVVGDMADFQLKQPVDVCFNMINSFRHLGSEEEAQSHLNCVADALKPGGLYLLGLHLTPEDDDWEGEETWHARRGQLSIISDLRTTDFDRTKRVETLGMTFHVTTPTRSFVMRDTMHYRTYTKREMAELFEAVDRFEILETYDFCYDIEEPIVIDELTEDVVYVLRAK